MESSSRNVVNEEFYDENDCGVIASENCEAFKSENCVQGNSDASSSDCSSVLDNVPAATFSPFQSLHAHLHHVERNLQKIFAEVISRQNVLYDAYLRNNYVLEQMVKFYEREHCENSAERKKAEDARQLLILNTEFLRQQFLVPESLAPTSSQRKEFLFGIFRFRGKADMLSAYTAVRRPSNVGRCIPERDVLAGWYIVQRQKENFNTAVRVNTLKWPSLQILHVFDKQPCTLNMAANLLKHQLNTYFCALEFDARGNTIVLLDNGNGIDSEQIMIPADDVIVQAVATMLKEKN